MPKVENDLFASLAPVKRCVHEKVILDFRHLSALAQFKWGLPNKAVSVFRGQYLREYRAAEGGISIAG